MPWNALNPDEERVIVRKGTEPPFSGEYNACHAEGVYLCRRCNAVLFRSRDKFDSGCGWPAFDEAVIGAVTRLPDPDGMRTEIVCARCAGHLGHVFLGEKATVKDTRYCVNSLSMRFVPARDPAVPVAQTACFGGGCFWCLEAVFSLIQGVNAVQSGYAGGWAEDPDYEAVCQGTTGHAEVVRVDFDPLTVSYEGLLDVFFACHDPSQVNRQGADRGPQYRSVIFYMDESQKESALARIAFLKSSGQTVMTAVEPFARFYPAEEAHQEYFQRQSGAPYCRMVILPKIFKIKECYKNYLK